MRFFLNLLVPGMFLIAQNAEACSVCYGALGQPLTEGLNMGIICLLVIVLFVLGLFATFFIQLVVRSRGNHYVVTD